MKKQYKELFYDIKPDEELLFKVLNTRKPSSNKKYFIAAAACITACVVAAVFSFTNNSETISNSVDIPIAYETKLQPEPQKHIERIIGNGKKNIRIDGDVIIEGNIKKMKVYKAEIKKYSFKSIYEILYGKNGLYYGDKNKSAIFETELGGITFNVNIDIDSNDSQKSLGEDYADGCSFPYSVAKNLADLFPEKNNMEDFRFKEGRIEKSYSHFHGNWRSGFYLFNYIQYADGFPVETVASDVDSSVASDLSIKIDNEGIVGLNMFGLDLTEKNSAFNDLISVEGAIDIIENEIDNLWLSEFAPIVEIRLEYILDKKEGNCLELVPCWHFCIDQTELKKLDIQTQRENDTNDLCVNAVTGEIYRVADRYPVFQTANGLVSTWDK